MFYPKVLELDYSQTISTSEKFAMSQRKLMQRITKMKIKEKRAGNLPKKERMQ